MKVPSDIKKKIKDCYKFSIKALSLNKQIRQWMIENELANDLNIDQLIDTLELGQGSPESLILFLETQAEIGNNDDYI